MEKDHYIGLAVALCVVAAGIIGGSKNAQNLQGALPGAQTPAEQQQQAEVQQKINDTQKQVDNLKSKLQAENDAKNYSTYRGLVTLQYVGHSSAAASEYIVLRVASDAASTIPITGWTLHSLASGVSVSIPSGTQLFFAGIPNSESPVILSPGDTAYILTGLSPNGASFRLNKCSGYLSQFQTFTPSISSNCPAPRNENLSSIPRRVENDTCFDYIDGYPTCRIQTEPIPANWSYECKNFIYSKINYPSCVDTHKNDADFYQKEWRIYLKRNETLWKSEREEIVLYDANGRIVDDLKY